MVLFLWYKKVDNLQNAKAVFPQTGNVNELRLNNYN